MFSFIYNVYFVSCELLNGYVVESPSSIVYEMLFFQVQLVIHLGDPSCLLGLFLQLSYVR